MPKISQSRIAVLATHGYERSELRKPLEALRAQGAHVDVVAPEAGEIRSWDDKDWGDSVAVDRVLGEVTAEDYDALVLPGGQINPDLLRLVPEAIALVRAFVAAGKPVAAICHAPWLLIDAEALRGRAVTSYGSIRKDVENAGGLWRDASVVVDRGIVTSRNPHDIDDFVAAFVKEVEGARVEQVA